MASRAALVRSTGNRKKAVQSKKAASPALNGRRPRFVVCIDAREYADVDLDVGKVYQALPTEKSARDQALIRVIDNSGEDYLFSAEQFVEVKLPRVAQEAVLRAR